MSTSERFRWDTGDLADMPFQRSLVAQSPAGLVVELYHLRRQELLEGPSSGQPSTLSEIRKPDISIVGTVSASEPLPWYVTQVYITLLRLLVPAEHGGDGSVELDIIGFVDAAGIDPEISYAIVPCLLGTELEFQVSTFPFANTFLKILERHLFFIRAPGV